VLTLAPKGATHAEGACPQPHLKVHTARHDVFVAWTCHHAGDLALVCCKALRVARAAAAAVVRPMPTRRKGGLLQAIYLLHASGTPDRPWS
jgi:hypothetical protein